MYGLIIVFPLTVFKRSVSEIPNCAKFAQFGGKHIEQVNIDNMAAVLAYESQNKN